MCMYNSLHLHILGGFSLLSCSISHSWIGLLTWVVRMMYSHPPDRLMASFVASPVLASPLRPRSAEPSLCTRFSDKVSVEKKTNTILIAVRKQLLRILWVNIGVKSEVRICRESWYGLLTLKESKSLCPSRYVSTMAFLKRLWHARWDVGELIYTEMAECVRRRDTLTGSIGRNNTKKPAIVVVITR